MGKMGKRRTTTDPTGDDDDGDGAEGAAEESSGRQVSPLVADRVRAWELYLRGMSKAAIARELKRDRGTVAGWIQADYVDLERERVVKRQRDLLGAIARLRNVQRAAWADHDADDERERAVLAAAIPGTRYQSQRSQYLRVVMDAEREIARLCGLYEAGVLSEGTVVFRLERLSYDAVTGFSAPNPNDGSVSADHAE